MVVLVKDDPYGYGPRLWVVIDAPRPDDNPRYRVYAADFDVVKRFADFPYDFRLINLQEVLDSLDEIVPEGKIRFIRNRVA